MTVFSPHSILGLKVTKDLDALRSITNELERNCLHLKTDGETRTFGLWGQEVNVIFCTSLDDYIHQRDLGGTWDNPTIPYMSFSLILHFLRCILEGPINNYFCRDAKIDLFKLDERDNRAYIRLLKVFKERIEKETNNAWTILTCRQKGIETWSIRPMQASGSPCPIRGHKHTSQ